MTVTTAIDMRPPAEAATAVQTGFDYAQIDEGIRDEVRIAARAIHQLEQGVITGILAIGKRLLEVKDMIPHGQFTEWVLGEFNISERMAQNYMNVAREYGDLQNRNKISLFSPTVAYLLAAPSTPEEARAEVEQAAAQGQKVTVEFAKEAIRKAKPEPEPVRYAPVWELERHVNEWLAEKIGEGGAPTPDNILDNLAGQYGWTEQAKHGWLSMLCDSLIDAKLHWRRSDLSQAINNVREQRRTAARQAQARTVYPSRASVEPIPPKRVPGQDAVEAVINAEQAEEHAEPIRPAIKDRQAWMDREFAAYEREGQAEAAVRRYATVAELEDAVNAWLEASNDDPDVMLAEYAAASGEPNNQRRRELIACLAAWKIDFWPHDLAQAVAKVTQARHEEAAAVVAVATERAQEEAERLAINEAAQVSAGTVTVMLPRPLAALLQAQAAACKLGDLNPTQQAAIWRALEAGLKGEGE